MKKILLLLLPLSIAFILAGCDDVVKADEYVDKGDEYMEQGEPDNAVSMYEKALNLNEAEPTKDKLDKAKDKLDKTKAKKQKKEVYNLIKQKDYDKAINVAEKYKDQYSLDNHLRSFAVALQAKDNDDLQKFYRNITAIPDDYDGLLAGDIKEQKNELEELMEDKKQEIVDQLIEFLNNEQYDKANYYVSDLNVPDSLSMDDLYINTLEDYARVLSSKEKLEKEGNGPSKRYFSRDDKTFYSNLGDISVDVMKNIDSGFGNKVQSLKEKYKEQIDERSEEVKEQRKNRKEREKEMSKPVPEIGMTADEVKESRWGRPKEINKTKTENGEHEQWVYSDQRYIYLDDGVVTSIQE